jgi:fermentation-respiration switch protein FrsA (DUF1100 family)
MLCGLVYAGHFLLRTHSVTDGVNHNRFRIVFLLCIILLFLEGCGSLFFYPRKELYDNPVARLFGPEDITFKASDGVTLHGWFFQALGEPKATVLVFHGNAENLSTHVNSVLWLVKAGFNVFIFDYRGYGRSEGSPGIKGVHLDGAAALETALNLPRTRSVPVVVLGQSIGGAIAVYTVAHAPDKSRIAALVIDSAFASYRIIAREKLDSFWLTWPFQYPLSFLVGNSYSPLYWIGKVTPVPLLILHGEKDPIVPDHHGRMLYDAAVQPKEFWSTPFPGHIMSFADEAIRKKFVDYLCNKVKHR